MKTAKIQKLIKGYLLPAFKPCDCAGRMMFYKPLRSVLRAIYFEDSGFNPAALYAWVFVQPLYIPSEHVNLTFGHRLMNRIGGRQIESWSIGAEFDEHQIQSLTSAIRNDAVPYLQKLVAPQDIADHLKESTGLSDNVFVREAVACSLAKIGEYGNAKKELEALIRSVSPEDPWHNIKPRAEELLACINERTECAGDLLDKWEHDTVENLHLPIR